MIPYNHSKGQEMRQADGFTIPMALFNLKVQELRQSLKPNTEITDKGGTV